MKIAALLLMLISLCSCGVSVSQPQPFPNNYKAEITEALDEQLFDGASARIKWDAPPFLMGKDDKRRYFSKFRVNAKNRLGGYVGWMPYSADFIDGRLNNVIQNPYSALLKPN